MLQHVKGKYPAMLAAAMALLLVGSACGPSAQAPAQETTGGSGVASGPVGKAVVAFVPQTTGGWDPATYGGAADTPNTEALYSRLLDYEKDSLKVVPGLAEKWSMSLDGLTWEFNIRKGVRFHNGDEVTAEDVAYTWDRLKRLAQPQTKANIEARVESVEARGDSVVVRLKMPDWRFPESMAGGSYSVVPKKYVEQVGDAGFVKAPIGSGPFKFVEGSKQEFLQFEAVDYEHFLRQPGVKRLRYVIVPEETTRLAMVRTGEADLAQITAASLGAMEKDTRVRVIKAPAPGGLRLFLLGQEDPQNPMSKLEVRQALSLAIDRQAIAEHVYKGYAKPAGTGQWNPGQPGFPAWGNQAPPYDMEKAKELLAKAGYPGGKGLKITFHSTEYGGLPGWTQVSPVLASQWEKLGIQVEIRNWEWGAWSAMIREGKFTPVAASVGTGMGGGPTGAFDQVLNRNGPYRYVAGIAQGMHSEVAELYERFLSELDETKRNQVRDKIMEYTRNNLTDIPVVFIDGLWAGGPRLLEYTPRPGTYSIGNMWTIKVKP